MAGVLLYGTGVDLSLDLSHLGLEFDEVGVVVVIAFNLGLQPPVAVHSDLIDDVGVWGRVGSDSLEEPGWDNVGGGFAGNGWLSVELVEVDAIVGASEGSLNEAGAWQAANIMGLEVDSVDLDEEVGDTACILLESVGAFLLDAVIVVVALELSETGSHGSERGVSGGESHLLGGEGLLVIALHAPEAELGVVGFVEGHLGNLFCKIESHFRG